MDKRKLRSIANNQAVLRALHKCNMEGKEASNINVARLTGLTTQTVTKASRRLGVSLERGAPSNLNGDAYYRVKEILEQTPRRTLGSIGQEVGVTRERVRQLCNKISANGGPVRERVNNRPSCEDCSKPVSWDNKSGYCSFCGKERNKRFFTCPECGTEMVLRPAEYERKISSKFPGCSHSCSFKQYWRSRGGDRV